jgi:peptidoglycan/xylan/chitin deacetylase (PgdA/CDA1 family)
MSILTNEVVNRGYKYYDWNISSGDAAGGSPTPTQIRNNVVNSLRKDRINMVLMHDIKTYTRDALRDIIKYGKDNGYTFEKITMDTTMVKQRVNN